LGRKKWDVIILDWGVRSYPALAKALKSEARRALKIVLTEKEHLKSSIEFWGSNVYSYLLKPINPSLFQLVWQNAKERVRLGQGVKELKKAQKRPGLAALEHQEALKELFFTHLKMQELDQEKTHFLARTCHELRTPLTALQGYIELLREGRAGEVNELQQQLLSHSLGTCKRLLSLANSLIDLGALHSGSSALRLEPNEIRECVLRAVSDVRREAAEKNLDLQVYPGEPIQPFRFDFDRMQQVFVNLLDNAVKFTPPGGRICVCCAPQFWEKRMVREIVCLSPERRQKAGNGNFNSVLVSVEDTGVGIQRDLLPDIFREYSRVENGCKSPNGFGLGLAIARQILLAHEGKLWAQSQPGAGSRFNVLIPLSL
jgi:signal transduction histidine kinase